MNDDERAALNQAITTAMDMTRAGIAQSDEQWTVNPYGSWWEITCGTNYQFFATKKEHAKWLADKLNGKA